LNRSS